MKHTPTKASRFNCSLHTFVNGTKLFLQWSDSSNCKLFCKDAYISSGWISRHLLMRAILCHNQFIDQRPLSKEHMSENFCHLQKKYFCSRVVDRLSSLPTLSNFKIATPNCSYELFVSLTNTQKILSTSLSGLAVVAYSEHWKTLFMTTHSSSARFSMLNYVAHHKTGNM